MVLSVGIKNYDGIKNHMFFISGKEKQNERIVSAFVLLWVKNTYT